MLNEKRVRILESPEVTLISTLSEGVVVIFLKLRQTKSPICLSLNITSQCCPVNIL